ncbi:glutamyl-tRNA reductase [Leptospira langatensis]|uniref:Glutamyl-tRNA reductase n=1 Tax=Leptospira langatensis TaxID=2484983 RepID=A0A5F1ZQ84_9LEPT|nr:glutamyl-tRNA reductase [Leptospira langatensis]TGK01734.1 glutamyl-tRNA reductase [Leptospira langatensis]TGL39342.1 glutamyl-tRNA reductase [Leptospira langatensis]
MWSTLQIFHSEANDRDMFSVPDSFSWKTCMRTVLVSDSRIHLSPSELPKNWESKTGYEAYRLLLEIISGLKSKLFGETEVLAQFRQRFQELPDEAFGEYLAKLRDNLIEDCRTLRSGYLQNLGEQSYGGLADKYLSEAKNPPKEVVLFGTGQLAEKLLPWLSGSGKKTKIVGRNPNRLDYLASISNSSSHLMEDWSPNGEAWVIAAPMDFSPWMDKLAPGNLILDFREEPLESSWPSDVIYISFADMLSSLKETEERTKKVKEELKSVLDELLQEREWEAHQIVFGWDDLPCPTF